MEPQIIICDATPADVRPMAEVYAASWKVAYRGAVPDSYLSTLTYQHWEPTFAGNFRTPGGARSAVAVTREGRIVGASHYGRCRDADLGPEWGELISIYLLPDYWSKGIGNQLMTYVLEQLEKMGHHNISLWMHRENHRARRAYERFGFHPDGATLIQEIEGQPLEEIRLVRQTT